MLSPEQIRERLDREIAAAERHVQALRDFRDALLGAPGGLSAAEEAELRERAARAAARMRGTRRAS